MSGEATTHSHSHDHDHDHGHDHGPSGKASANWKPWLPAISCAALLTLALLLDHQGLFTQPWQQILFYSFAWAPVGLRVSWKSLTHIFKGEPFNEFFLMSIATIGALCIGEYEEGVAVMLFYEIGELVQSAAVRKSKRSIQALLQERPVVVRVLRDGEWKTVKGEQIKKGEILQVQHGEKLSLDGVLVSANATLNAASITGEYRPLEKQTGAQLLAGMVNEGGVFEMKVTAEWNDTRMAHLMKLVQEATLRKAPTEQTLRKFARIYTPAVFFAAVALTFLPALFIADYHFQTWLYRALVFLVISCPCALLISIPLGYFGGIGLASRNGILLKGAGFLDALRKVNVLLLDKTGTLTHGKPEVDKILAGEPAAEWMELAVSLCRYSSHPLSASIAKWGSENKLKEWQLRSILEKPGLGLEGFAGESCVRAGNRKWLEMGGVHVPESDNVNGWTLVHVSVNGKYTGSFALADKIKPGVKETLQALRQEGIEEMALLSGDEPKAVKQVAEALAISPWHAGLMPEDKYKIAQQYISQGKVVAYAGDGVNDAPVLALAQVGIAMGGMGSDAAIETADMVIQGDDPDKIRTAIAVSKATHAIVMQNMALAFGVKLAVLALGAGGIATLWEAVFADVGVALLAILNAARLQHKQIKTGRS